MTKQAQDITGVDCRQNESEVTCNQTVDNVPVDDGTSVQVQRCVWIDEGIVDGERTGTCMPHPCDANVVVVRARGKKMSLTEGDRYVHVNKDNDGEYSLTCACPQGYFADISTSTDELWDSTKNKYNYDNIWYAGGDSCAYKVPLYYQGIQHDPSDPRYKDALKAGLCQLLDNSTCSTLTSEVPENADEQLCTAVQYEGQSCAPKACSADQGDNCVETGTKSNFAPCGMGSSSGYLSIAGGPLTPAPGDDFSTATCGCVQQDSVLDSAHFDDSKSGGCTLSLCTDYKDETGNTTPCGPNGTCVTQTYQHGASLNGDSVQWIRDARAKIQSELSNSYRGNSNSEYQRMNTWLDDNEQDLKRYDRLQYCQCDQNTQSYTGVCQTANFGCPSENGLTCSGGGLCNVETQKCECYINHYDSNCAKLDGPEIKPYEQTGSCYIEEVQRWVPTGPGTGEYRFDHYEPHNNCGTGLKPIYDYKNVTCSCACDPDTILNVKNSDGTVKFPAGCLPATGACKVKPTDTGPDCTGKQVFACASVNGSSTCAQVPYTDPGTGSVSTTCAGGGCYLSQQECYDNNKATCPQPSSASVEITAHQR